MAVRKKIGICEIIRWPFLAITAVVILFPILIVCATPANYKKRIDSVRVGIDELLSSDLTSDIERDSVDEIEHLIPPNETIELSGTTVETDNRWLKTRLDDFIAEKNEAKRDAILNEISERLDAIYQAVDDLDRASGGQNVEQDKQKLDEILKRAEFQKPEPPEKSVFQRWLDAILEWLSKKWPRSSSNTESTSDLSSLKFVLQILVYAAVIGLVGFLLYRFLPFLSSRFSTREKRDKRDRVILGERISSDESASDLFSEAERLAREGNLRAAIRKGYIAALCDLADRKIVRLARHKTNRDYLRDVRKNQSLFANLTGLTLNFETSWYGLRAVDDADWDEFRNNYRETIASAGRNRGA